MARKPKKEITCSVTITEGASERLTKELVKIYYQRKKDAQMQGVTDDKTA